MTSPSPSLPAKIFAFLCSFGLATTVLSLLLLITFLGTLEQAEHGLVVSQARYFESFFVDRIDVAACLRALAVKDIGKFELPLFILPGGYTLMAVLFVNLLLGGIVRVRKSPKTIGVIISHFAILFMIASGAVTYHFAKEGILSLSEGQVSDEFQSFHERVIEIEKVPASADAKREALVIDEASFTDLGGAAARRTFTHASLPFELTISQWKRHAEPRRVTDDRGDAVDGYFVQERPLIDPKTGQAIEDEKLFSACLATVKAKDGSEQKGILWEIAAAPWTVTVEGQKYLINLKHRTYRLPFAVRLDKTEAEKHPGTERARRFTSWVTKITNGHEEKRMVTMNEPVRGGGYAVFQSTFGDGMEDGTGVKSSGFQIVENPADHWPLISCVVVAEGLLLHFLMMLARFIKTEPWRFAIGFTLAFNAAFALAMWKLL